MQLGFSTTLIPATAKEPLTLLTLLFALTHTKYHERHQRRAFYDQVLQRAAAIPGVKGAVGVSALPFSDHSSGREFSIEGRPADPSRMITGMYQPMTPGYFDTLHVPVRAGRFLDQRDGPDSP